MFFLNFMVDSLILDNTSNRSVVENQVLEFLFSLSVYLILDNISNRSVVERQAINTMYIFFS